jgi:hypothetical protein
VLDRRLAALLATRLARVPSTHSLEIRWDFSTFYQTLLRTIY